MSWVAPGWLAAAAAASLIVLAIHFLARRRPARRSFPTARFVPEASARATTRAFRPTDLALLALRIALLMLVGAAFAGPAREAKRRDHARLVIVDRSRAVADIGEVRRAAALRLGPGTVLIVFDSAARVLSDPTTDTIAALSRTTARGSISAALAAAAPAAMALARAVDTVSVVLISPLAREELDRATAAIRPLIPGAIELVMVRAETAPGGGSIEVRALADDPVRAAAELSGDAGRQGAARLARTAPRSDDSSFARSGGVLIVWPVDSAPPDTAGAVVYRRDWSTAVVGHLGRRRIAHEGRPVARWLDGAPAAVERPFGAGCIREVGAEPPRAGDLTLTPAFADFVRYLAAPCGHPDFGPIGDEQRAMLARAPERGVRLAEAPPAPDPGWVRWLLVLAGLLALGELLVRSRSSTAR